MASALSTIPTAFRAHIRRHNREVLWLTLLSAGAAALVWGGIYALSQMVSLVLLTAANGVNAEQFHGFNYIFSGGALGLCLLRASTRQWLRPEKFRIERHYGIWVFLELLFFPANLVLGIPGNLSAYLWLNRDELAATWDLVHSLDKKRKVRLSEIPRLIPDEALRNKAFAAAQICELIYLMPIDHDWLLQLKNDEAAKLASGSVRFAG